jgi:hypothetical protein
LKFHFICCGGGGGGGAQFINIPNYLREGPKGENDLLSSSCLAPLVTYFHFIYGSSHRLLLSRRFYALVMSDLAGSTPRRRQQIALRRLSRVGEEDKCAPRLQHCKTATEKVHKERQTRPEPRLSRDESELTVINTRKRPVQGSHGHHDRLYFFFLRAAFVFLPSNRVESDPRLRTPKARFLASREPINHAPVIRT